MAIKQTVIAEYKSQGADKVVADTDRIGKAQTRLGQASASSGRQFSAQAAGLGGVVGIYAAAAANVFALSAAFTALNRAAQFETILRGTEALANSVGTSSTAVLRSIKDITNGQLSLIESAEQANLALSAGFNTEQIEKLANVANKASKALGRNLTDAFQRITRGAIKLEPELLDEIGIFTRIDPAVEKYAAQIGKSVNQLSQFERRQAFVNQVIADGEKAFRDIDTSVLSTQEKFERLIANFTDLALVVGNFIADQLAPLAEFIDKSLGNRLLLLGSIGLLVFNNLRKVIQGFLTTGLASANTFLSQFADNIAKNKKSAEELGIAYKKVGESFKGLGAFAGGTAADRTAGAELKKSLATGTLSTQQALDAQKTINRLKENELAFQDRINKGLDNTVRTEDQRRKAIENSAGRVTVLNQSMEAVKAQTQGAGIAARALAAGITSAGRAAAALGGLLSKAFGLLNVIIIGFSTAQFFLSFFDIDLFSTVKDLIASIGKESRNTSKGFEDLAAAARKNADDFSDLADQLGIAQSEFASVTSEALEYLDAVNAQNPWNPFTYILETPDAGEKAAAQLEVVRRELEDLQKAAAGQRVSGPRIRTLTKGYDSVSEAIEATERKIKKFEAATKLASIATGALANGITKLSIATEKSGEIFARGALAGTLVEDGKELKVVLDDLSFSIGTISDDGVVTLTDGLSKVGGNSVDAANKLRDLTRDLREGTTSAERASKEVGILEKLLLDAKEAASKAGNNEALKAIEQFLKNSVEPAKALTRELANIDAFSERLNKLYSGSTAIVDDAVVKGLVTLSGDLVTNEKEQLKVQAQQAAALRRRADTYRTLQRFGYQLTETGERTLELEKQQQKLSAARQFALVFTLEKETKERKKALDLANLQYNIALAQVEAAERRLEREKKINEAKVSNETLKNELSISEKLNELANLQVEAVQKRIQFENTINSIISERANLLSQIEQTQYERGRAELDARDQGRITGAQRDLERAETQGLPSQKELIQLRLKVVEAESIAQINAIRAREEIAEREERTQIAAIERREQALLKESRDSETLLNRRLSGIIREERLFEAQTQLADKERALRQTELNNQIANIRDQAEIQKAQTVAQKTAKLAELEIQKGRAELVVAQIQADQQTLTGQYQFLNDLRTLYNDVFDLNLGKIENPIEANYQKAQTIVDNFGKQIKVVGNTYDEQINLADKASQTQINGLKTQQDILTEQQTAANVVADITRAIFAERKSATEQEFLDTTAIIAEKLKSVDLEKQAVRDKLVLELEKAGIDRQTAISALNFAREKAQYEASEQARIRAAYLATQQIVGNYVENGLMQLNTALIEGNLTFKSVTRGFRDMLQSMLKEIQAAVFRKTIAEPIAEGISSFLPKLFAAGGAIHLAGGGSMKRDRVAAMLEPGEFVIRKEAAKKLGMSKLQELNAGTTDDPLARLIAMFGGSKVSYKAGGGSFSGNPHAGGYGPSGVGGMGSASSSSSSFGGGKEVTPGYSSGQVDPGLFSAAGFKSNMGMISPGINAFGNPNYGAVYSSLTESEKQANDPLGYQQAGTLYDSLKEGNSISDQPYGPPAPSSKPKSSTPIYSSSWTAPPAKKGLFDVDIFGGTLSPNISGLLGDDKKFGLTFTKKFAGGGSVAARDRVPALLEPGEFVIRRPMAKAIGGAALNQMNATGRPPQISVNMTNQGAPKDVAVAPPRMNGDKIILDIITRDLRNNGAIKKTLRKGK